MNPRTVQLLIELDPVGEPIAGRLRQQPHGPAVAFIGWLQLTQAIEAIRSSGVQTPLASAYTGSDPPDSRFATGWDASIYDITSEPQQAWAADVLARLGNIEPDATVLDVGCGTGRVTESLLALVPCGRVLAIDLSANMVKLARRRLGERVRVLCGDVLELELAEPVDVIVSTAALHWVIDHERMWARLARALRPGGILEVQCGGAGNLARVRDVIATVARDAAPELVDWSPWEFATPQETEQRLRKVGFTSVHCWLEDRPTTPDRAAAFVRTSILSAHLARLPEARRESFAAEVLAAVRLPLDYVRLNVSAVRRAA